MASGDITDSGSRSLSISPVAERNPGAGRASDENEWTDETRGDDDDDDEDTTYEPATDDSEEETMQEFIQHLIEQQEDDEDEDGAADDDEDDIFEGDQTLCGGNPEITLRTDME